MRIDTVTTPVMPSQSRLVHNAASKDDKELKKACKEFESVLTGMMFKAMRKSVMKNDLFGSNKEEEMFSDMLDTQMAEESSEKNPNGIAEMLYRQLTVNQMTGSVDKRGDKQ